MRKIGIITLSGYDNYGNRLQSFAMEYIFRKFGEVETLFQRSGEIYSPHNANSFLYNYCKFRNDFSGNKLIERIFNNTPKINGKYLRIKRFIKFKEFSQKYLNERDYHITGNNYIAEDICNKYNFIIVGSDQVWNPNWIDDNLNCLIPVETTAVKVSYAASFGVSNINDEDKLTMFSSFLKDFNKISVREFTGLDILEKIAIKNGQFVLDPTMLLTVNQWEEYLYPHKGKPDSPYLFIYVLGETTDDMKKLFKFIKENSNLEIVTVNSFQEEKYYDTDPFEFLDYIKNAKLVITDSYHGIVFSNIFNTPYIIFERKCNLPNMNSRIDTLDQMFKVNSRKISSLKLEELEEIYEQDFSYYNLQVQKYKEISFNFINKVFERK